jgi:hypothetical protein
MFVTSRASIRVTKERSLKEGLFSFTISKWTRARGVCRNIPLLSLGEAGASPAGSTQEVLKTYEWNKRIQVKHLKKS